MLIKVAATMLVVSALAGPAAAASGGCHEVEGDFTAVLVPPGPTCPSPIFCTLGTLTGDLAGTYFFAVEGFGPSGELLAASTITLENGAVIEGGDTSVINPDGTFATTVNVGGGTRQYAHARGQIVATGHFTESGTEGSYAGEVCLGIGASV